VLAAFDETDDGDLIPAFDVTQFERGARDARGKDAEYLPGRDGRRSAGIVKDQI
jgi:hypothetical protein